MIEVRDAYELRGIKGFWYVATPYTKFDGGIEAAYEAAMDFDSKLEWARVKRFTPIVWSHQIARETGIDPKDHQFWMGWDKPMMEKAAGLIVGDIPGWQESDGVGQEIKFFEGAGRPIALVDPITFDWVY